MDNQIPKRFERKPNFEMHTKLSKDGRYWIIKRSETWILPRKYIDVVIENNTKPKNESATEECQTKTISKGK